MILHYIVLHYSSMYSNKDRIYVGSLINHWLSKRKLHMLKNELKILVKKEFKKNYQTVFVHIQERSHINKTSRSIFQGFILFCLFPIKYQIKWYTIDANKLSRSFILLIITNFNSITFNDRSLAMCASRFAMAEEMNGQETRVTMTDATRRTFRRKGVPGWV